MNLFKFLKPKYVKKPGALRSSVSSGTSQKIAHDMSLVKTYLQGKQPSQLRQALIVTDKALDNALKDCFAGTSMGERLKNARDAYERDLYNRIWQAHKMRNALVHEAGYEPPYHMIIKGIDDLKEGMAVLGVRV